MPFVANLLAGHWVVKDVEWAGAMWQNSPGLLSFAGVVDTLFLLLAAVVPILKSLYFLYFFRGNIDAVVLTLEVNEAKADSTPQAMRQWGTAKVAPDASSQGDASSSPPPVTVFSPPAPPG